MCLHQEGDAGVFYIHKRFKNAATESSATYEMTNDVDSYQTGGGWKYISATYRETSVETTASFKYQTHYPFGSQFTVKPMEVEQTKPAAFAELTLADNQEVG